MRQLQNSGVIDVVKIRAYGYPERIVQQEFYQVRKDQDDAMIGMMHHDRTEDDSIAA